MAYTVSDVVKQITEEHEQIKKGMADIQGWVKTPITEKDFHDWRLEFIWRLREFRNHLLRHFDFEEDGGFMHELMEEAPEKTSQIKILSNQHHEIAEDLDHIIKDLKSMEHVEKNMSQEIRQHVLDIIDKIHTHETAEVDLMQAIYYQDYGYPS